MLKRNGAAFPEAAPFSVGLYRRMEYGMITPYYQEKWGKP